MFARKVSLIVAVAAATVIACFPNTSARAVGEPAPAPTISDTQADELAHAVEVRQTFGLNSDQAFVSSLMDQPGLDTTTLGVPLTADEAADMQFRDQVAEALIPVGRMVRAALPDSFAGVWMDQESGGAAVVAATVALPATLRTAVTNLLPHNSRVAFKVVGIPAKRLDTLMDTFDSSVPVLAAQGIHLSSWALSPDHNQVEVRLADGSSDGDVQKLLNLYGSAGLAVSVGDDTHFTASRTATTGTLYGGSRIFGNSSISGECTLALNGKATDGSGYYGITAGHCAGIYDANPVRRGTTSGPSLNYTQQNVFYGYSQTNCDCLVFGYLPGTVSTNSVIVDSGNTFPYTSYAGYADDYVQNRAACISGATSNKVLCDKIRNPRSSYSGGGITVVDQFQVYCGVLGGDSGAPVGDGGTWLGINSNGTGYSSVANACGTSATRFNASKAGYVPLDLPVSVQLTKQ